MLIDMDPDIARIFQSSTHVSVAKGTSSALMKPNAKRRRSKWQIKEEEKLAQQREKEIGDKLAAYEALAQANQELSEQLENSNAMY